MTVKKTTIIGFRAEPPLQEALTMGAARMQISRSDYVRHLLREALGLVDYATNSNRQNARTTQEAS